MKRLITAVSLAVLAISAAANTGKPFEQLDIDRALPNVSERSVTQKTERQYASSGNSRSDVEIARDAEPNAFAEDHNFIAPAQ